MPSLGADMDSGILLEWRVGPGDRVKRGDIVAVVETSKADIEVEIFEDGVIEELLADEGERVPVGTPIARVATVTGNGDIPAVAPASPQPAAARPAPPAPAPGPAHQHRPRVSPLARRTAEGLGVDLAGVRGSGPGGAITRADVERAAATGEPAPREPAVDDRRAAMREAIAKLMARSKREIPHYYLAEDVDMSAAESWLRETNSARPVAERLVSAALLLKATALAVKRVPEVNGFFSDGRFEASEQVHLGVAIALRGGGLVAPAIHDADRLAVDELMAALRDLVRRARAGTLRGSEMSDPTVTVTNLGELGVDAVTGVIYPPQVALVGFGTVAERAWASGGMVGARPVVTATLAADHRVSDGARGARLLTSIGDLLQHPEEL
jgi:pyruvate dehydrogenase E2 component (dihydrolipoamide acetyltransferase)